MPHPTSLLPALALAATAVAQTGWVQRNPATRPPARSSFCMTHDAARGVTVLFGGWTGSVLLNDTWEWNGVNWTQRFTSVSPHVREAHALATDIVRARVVLFGGTNGGIGGERNDTWEFDGNNWMQALPANQPSPRRAYMAFDLVRGRVVLFGGSIASTRLDDTWEYDPGTLARWTAQGSGCLGTSGVPVLRPLGASLPILGTTFVMELSPVPGTAAAISFGFSNTQWNGNTLPWDLGAIGMTGCTLHVSPETVFVMPVLVGRAWLVWTVPTDPNLVGVRFFNQGFVLDPGVNPLGATVSNAGEAIIGPL